MEKFDINIFDEIEDNRTKAQLCQEMLHNIVATSQVPMEEPLMYKCQLLSEMVSEYTEKANSLVDQLRLYIEENGISQ